APFNGTTYNVGVSGMTGPGSVIIHIPGGAAIGTNGLPSLPATILDNHVDYELLPPQDLLLVWDNFNAPTTNSFTPLHGVGSGTGWSTAWQVQNYNAATYTEGYAVQNTAPLSYGSLVTSGNYAVGGRGYEMSVRELNVDGAFANYRIFDSVPSSIGLDGTTLWLSVLLRKETADLSPVYVNLVNASGMQAYGQIDIAAGFFGDVSTVSGTRYWSLAVRNASNGADVIRSDVPLVVGETALLVLRMQFGATDNVSLFVNPSLGGAAPTLPNATASVSQTNLAFRSVRFYAGLGGGIWSGDGLNRGSMDELRIGDSYAAVTPVPLVGIAAWRQTHFGSTANSGAAADDADPDGDGILNFVEYALGGNPILADTSILPQPVVEADRFGLLFSPNAAATEVIWTIETRATLGNANWTPIAWKTGTSPWSLTPGVDISSQSNGATTVYTPGEVSGRVQEFIRLRISR
ncbi:MAG: hypothetical protein ACK4UN_18190, partial [Limisphaerales bacterium]